MNATSPKPHDIFVAALKLPPAEWARFLESACGEDRGLRQRLDLLLAAHREAGTLHPQSDQPAATCDQSSEHPGTQIGPYKLLEQIGEGGMGLVYMAEQQHPVRRLVALKIIKPGMDSKQVIARFEAERQALAMMDHPNIAKILDAGTVGQASSLPEQGPAGGPPHTGRPYFVMELVRGIPINEFCEQKRLTVRDRLLLFIQVCQAVQHAHQKGIIHRDLKPTNVLITLADTVAFPKIIDFGIAKALGQSLTDNTLHTGYSQLVGTPLYMSPEQAEMNLFGVDTRSDIYSLGVLLYELLTGTTPFDKEQLTKATFDEMRRIIREEEPETVSARIARTKSSPGHPHRGSAPRDVPQGPLSRSERATELDWIVMKSLEKDRNRRYESASSFAADIQRYLSDEPVLACPPTAMYRFQKIARKHKPVLVTAASIALCLLLGTTVSAWQAARATTAEVQAVANELKALANEKKASINAAVAEQKEQIAIQQRDEVKALADRLQRTLYAAHMNLAQRAWDEAVVPRLLNLLEQNRPKPGEPDLRGFEWHYLQRLYRGGQLLTVGPDFSYFKSVAFSPNGNRLITSTGGWTGTTTGEPEIQVWDAQTGEKQLALKGNKSVVLSPDGKRLAAPVTLWDHSKNAFVTAELKVWDAQTGQELFSLKGHTGNVTSVAFSPDGRRLATGSGDGVNRESAVESGEVKVWDVQTGQELLTLQGHTGDIRSVAFSPDGKRLAHGIRGRRQDGKRFPGTVKVCDAQTGKELFALSGGGGSVAYSSDGKRLASRSGGGGSRTPVSEELRVWDAETGMEISALKARSDGAIEFAFSPDAKRLVTAVQRGKMPSIKVCDTATGEEEFVLYGHSSSVSSLAFSPDSKILASGSEDRTLRLWELQTGQQIRSLQGHAYAISSVAFSPDGKRVASASSYGNVKIWDAQNVSEAITLHGTRTAISPDFTRLASAETDKSVKIWDANTRQPAVTLIGHTNEVLSLAFSPDGKRLVSGEGRTEDLAPIPDPVVKVWDAQSGHELHSLKGHIKRVTSVVFSPDGKLLASRGQGTFPGGTSDVKVWDAQTGRELLSLEGGVGSPWDSLAFSSDGKRLASAGRNVKVWDSQTGQELLTFKAGGGGIAFSSDGKRLANASHDDTVRIWDAQTGQELLTFKAGHTDYIMRLAFSTDDKRLVTACRDGLVKIWDAQAGHEILAFKSHTAGVENVAFTPDGHRMASASRDGTVKIYDATPLPEKP